MDEFAADRPSRSAGGEPKPPELVLPPRAVDVDLAGRQVAVRQHDHCVVAVRGEHDLDGRPAASAIVWAAFPPKPDIDSVAAIS